LGAADDAMITLARKCTDYGEITILQSRAKGSHIYCLGDWWQSEADRNGVSLATYIHAISGLLAQTPARDVLMIGCGGGTLGTMLSKTGRSVTVVDINPDSIAFAREYFSLPAEVTCHVDDGMLFLERHQSVFDAIVIDAFTEGRVPQHLCSVEFFQLVRQRLASSGCVFLNVFVPHGPDLYSDIIAGNMVDAGFEVRVLESPWPVERNAIIMGGAVAGLRPPTLLVWPAVMQDEIIAELECMQIVEAPAPRNSSADRESPAPVLEPQV
jgi:predicted membrane-bound spermidine synthase